MSINIPRFYGLAFSITLVFGRTIWSFGWGLPAWRLRKRFFIVRFMIPQSFGEPYGYTVARLVRGLCWNRVLRQVQNILWLRDQWRDIRDDSKSKEAYGRSAMAGVVPSDETAGYSDCVYHPDKWDPTRNDWSPKTVIDIFKLCTLGALLNAIMLIHILLMLYFEDRKGALITGGIYLSLHVLLTTFLLPLGFDYYGFSYFLAGLVAYGWSGLRLLTFEADRSTHIYHPKHHLQREIRFLHVARRENECSAFLQIKD